MDREDYLRRLGVFVIVLLIAFGGFAAIQFSPAPIGPEPISYTDVEVGTFQPESVLAEQATASGEVSMSADAHGETVLIGMAHENDVTQEQLGPLITTLTENGADVEFLSPDQASGSEFNESLRRADAFVSIAPEEPYTTEQIAGIEAFAAGGGRILLVGTPMQLSSGGGVLDTESGSSHPAPHAAVASQFGLAFGNGYLYNMQKNDNNFRSIFATPSGSSSLTEDIDRVAMRDVTPIYGGEPVLTGTQGTTLSTTRNQAMYPVASKSGNVVALGAPTLFTEPSHRQYDNEQLTGNLLDFLVSGEKAPNVPENVEE